MNRTTTKRVQATEGKPFALPTVPVKSEIDLDAWDADGLTGKQRAFVRAYIGPAAGNATKAAQLAGYRDDNTMALAATGCENLKKPNVQRALALAVARRAMNDPEWTRAGLADLCRASMVDFLSKDENGEWTLDLDRAEAHAALGHIKEFTAEVLNHVGRAKVLKVKVKLHDRIKALETLAKMQGAIVEKREVTHLMDLSRATDDELAEIERLAIKLDARAGFSVASSN